MDYRNRRYCLVLAPEAFTNQLDMIIKGILPNCKIHKLETDNDSLRHYMIKLFIGCKSDEYGILENILRTIPEITTQDYPYRKICKCIKFREITKEDLGQ